MALMNTGPNYTRTGHGFLTSLANKASFIPFIGGAIAAIVGYVDTAIEAVGWLLKGKPISAATVGVAGFVGSTVNGLTSGPGHFLWWGLNAGSGLASGRSMGTHARALTEGGIGALTGALGFRPVVLSSYPAGIGSRPGAAQTVAPGKFTRAEAARQNQDPDAMWNNYRSGNGQDYEALAAAQRAQSTQANR